MGLQSAVSYSCSQLKACLRPEDPRPKATHFHGWQVGVGRWPAASVLHTGLPMELPHGTVAGLHHSECYRRPSGSCSAFMSWLWKSHTVTFAIFYWSHRASPDLGREVTYKGVSARGRKSLGSVLEADFRTALNDLREDGQCPSPSNCVTTECLLLSLMWDST